MYRWCLAPAQGVRGQCENSQLQWAGGSRHPGSELGWAEGSRRLLHRSSNSPGAWRRLASCRGSCNPCSSLGPRKGQGSGSRPGGGRDSQDRVWGRMTAEEELWSQGRERWGTEWQRSLRVGAWRRGHRLTGFLFQSPPFGPHEAPHQQAVPRQQH